MSPLESRPVFSAEESRQRCLGYRRRMLEISQTVGAVHLAPAFSCLELVEVVYFGLMRRGLGVRRDDTFLLSKGHGSLAQYLVLEELGLLPRKHLENFCTPRSPLATHPDYGTPGIEASTGSLGHGLPLAVGMAYADLLHGSDRTIFVVMSDGELQEGSVWEALMLAPSLNTNRLVALIDSNDFQSLGRTSEILPNFYPIVEKLRAFGWEATEVNGHDAAAIYGAVTARSGDRPFALVGRTVKGRGVKFMENVPLWHYRSPSPQEFKQAISELGEVGS